MRGREAGHTTGARCGMMGTPPQFLTCPRDWKCLSWATSASKQLPIRNTLLLTLTNSQWICVTAGREVIYQAIEVRLGNRIRFGAADHDATRAEFRHDSKNGNLLF